MPNDTIILPLDHFMLLKNVAESLLIIFSSLTQAYSILAMYFMKK